MILKTSFAEYFRPNRLEDVVLPSRIKSIINGIIERHNMPSMIFHSTGFGFGKTSLAITLAKAIGCHVVFLKGGDRLGVAEISKLASDIQSGVPPIDLFDSIDQNVASHYPFHTIVIIDEADAMSRQAQTALKNLMESLDDSTRFIFTTNYVQKLDDALYKSGRTLLVDFTFNRDEQREMIRDSLSLVKKVCDTVGLNFDKDATILLLTKTMPSLRKTLLTLESIATFHGVFNCDTVRLCLVDVSYTDYYAALEKRDYLKVEKWVTSHTHLLNESFYDEVSEFFIEKILSRHSITELMEFLWC